MCGLFGVSAALPLSKMEKEACAFLSILSTPRGTDSTGLVGVERKFNNKDNEWEYSLEKETLSPIDFQREGNWNQFLQDKYHTIAGHNRWATVGDKSSKEGAHPFVLKGKKIDNFLIGMHNGTLTNYLDNKKDSNPNDSHKLFSAISSKGLKESLTELRENSAYALVWIDNYGEVNFFRNSQRPLWFMEDEFGGTLYWASEERFLKSMSEYFPPLKFKDPYLLKTNCKVKVNKKGTKLHYTVKKDYLEKTLIAKHERKVAYNSTKSWGRSNAVNYKNNGYGNCNYSNYHKSQYNPKTPGNSLKLFTKDKNSHTNRGIYRVMKSGTLGYDDGLILPYMGDKYDIAFEDFRYQECLASNIPFLSIDQDNYDITIHSFCSKKGKVKTTSYTPEYKNYDALWSIYFDHHELFSEFIQNKNLRWNKLLDKKYHTLHGLNREIRLLHIKLKNKNTKKIEEQKKENQKEREANTPVKKLLTSPNTGTISTEDKDVPKISPVENHYMGWELMSKSSAENILSNGCSNCCSQYSTVDEVYFLSRDEYICGECAELCSTYIINLQGARKGYLIQ